MKALVYGGPGQLTLMERPKPELQEPGDAIVRMLKTTICGTDLHIVKGDVPTCAAGRILGHEGVGVIESVGVGVSAFKPGDHVLISCISSCGKCEYCRRGMYSHWRPLRNWFEVLRGCDSQPTGAVILYLRGVLQTRRGDGRSTVEPG